MSIKTRVFSMLQAFTSQSAIDQASVNLNAKVEDLDVDWYLRIYPDVKTSGDDPQKHYIRHGWKERRNPSAEFDTDFYVSNVSGLTNPELCPLVHYSAFGRALKAPRSRAESLNVGGYSPPVAHLIEAFPDLNDHFDAKYYIERYPDVMLTDQKPLEHYLSSGWRQGNNPSEHFETAFYRETFQYNDIGDVCPLVHWLRYGRAISLPTTRDRALQRTMTRFETGNPDASELFLPNLDHETVAALCAPHFDVSHYLDLYPDIKSPQINPLRHYIFHGWQEGRSPSRFFDAAWYSKRNMGGEWPNQNPLLHFAVFGRMASRPGSAAQSMIQVNAAVDSAFGDAVRQLLGTLGFHFGLVNLDRVRRYVLPLFSAAHYRRERDIPSHVSDLDAFLRYLVLDFPGGRPPGPMFSTQHYLAEVRRKGITPPKYLESPFHHWMIHGVKVDISPSPGFNAQEYLKLNPDILKYPEGAFVHFIMHGQYEGRRFSSITVTASNRLAALLGETSTAALRFCEAAAATSSAEDSLLQMRNFLASGRLERTVDEATALEPEVGGFDDNISSFLAPWHDATWAEYSAFLKLLPKKNFESVVLMPFCKLGGADFVAGVLTTVLSESRSVLVIRTDADDWARPDWFPSDVATVDFSALFGPLNSAERMLILYQLLVHLRPKAVYNVNSRLAFDTFVRYGERLALQMRLNAYYFCADRTTAGKAAGYAIWYFSNVLAHLSCAIIDNAALARELVERYSLTGSLRDRVRVVYTPATSFIPLEPLAKTQINSTDQRVRKRIFWAGRFDAQKRFDLVQAIASLMPDTDFECWGKAVLGPPPDLSALPPNLKVNGPFVTYDELPLSSADGWLYTSAWDGMPTILIELGALGLPIVASSVGGVPELIDNSTGWPVNCHASAEDYVIAIRDMLSSPKQRVARALALQERIRSQHSREAYVTAVSGITATR